MKIQKIKNVGAEIMNVINELISRLDIAEGRISKSLNLKIGHLETITHMMEELDASNYFP